MSRKSKKHAAKRAPTAGSFVVGPDARRTDGQFKAGDDSRRDSFKEGADERRTAGQFKEGFDERRSAGGKPRLFKEFTAALRKEPPSFLVDELKKLMASAHAPTKMAAWKEWAKWSLGSAPAGGGDDIDVPEDPKELQRLIELDVQRRALAGDPSAQLIVLRALDPKKYGGDGLPDLGDGESPPTLNLVGVGEAREGHKPDAD